MIKIQEAQIRDILPFLFNTDEYNAISRAIARLTARFNMQFSTALFWADIQNAAEFLLDAMAAEIDAPFYRADMDADTKRAVIAAAFAYNRKIGTVGAVEKMLDAVFDNLGKVKMEEWFSYGGEPFYFKLTLPDSERPPVTPEFMESFLEMLDKVKNKRSKLEKFVIETILKASFYYYSFVGFEKKDTLVKEQPVPAQNQLNAGINVRFAFARVRKHTVIDGHINTYENLKQTTYGAIKGVTYSNVLQG